MKDRFAPPTSQAPWPGPSLRTEETPAAASNRFPDDPTRVALNVPAQAWFDLLPALGETLQLANNPAALLGQLGVAPCCTDWRNPQLPRSTDGRLAPNLAEFARLWAVRGESSPFGAVHSLEAGDNLGQTVFRVVLGTRARQSLFEQFVRYFQARPEDAKPWVPANHEGSVRRRTGLRNRISWLAERHAAGAGDLDRCAPQMLGRVLAGAATLEVPLRLLHYSRALISAAEWTPGGPPQSRAEDGTEIIFDSMGRTGLHFQPGAIGAVWLWRGRCACCGESKWSVEVADSSGHLALAITAVNDADSARWREALHTFLSE